MEIVFLSDDTRDQWDSFCRESDDAWFWHTTKWLDYCSGYVSSEFETKNISFFVQDNTGIVAIAPLLIEKRKDKDGFPHLHFSAAGSGGAVTAPALKNNLTESRCEKILKAVFENIDLLADKHGIASSYFRTSPLAPKNACYNLLLKYGYCDRSINIQLIDLTPPIEAIKNLVRKGHKYDINRGEKNYEIHIFDKTNPDKGAFQQYRLLHHKAAGRITRPLATFETMYNWICTGNGMLCGISKNGKFVGFSYIIMYKDGADYASMSDDLDEGGDIPISHIMQWSIILWLKEKGYKTYQIGVQQFGPLMHDIPNPKQLNISFFTRGFGGKTVPFFRGEKFYDIPFMKKIMKERCADLIETLEKNQEDLSNESAADKFMHQE